MEGWSAGNSLKYLITSSCLCRYIPAFKEKVALVAFYSIGHVVLKKGDLHRCPLFLLLLKGLCYPIKLYFHLHCQPVKDSTVLIAFVVERLLSSEGSHGFHSCQGHTQDV